MHISSVKNCKTERGGFILPFLVLIIAVLPLFFFLIDFAQIRLINMRMNRVVHHLDSKELILPKGQLGITHTAISGEKLTVTFKPYLPLFGKDEQFISVPLLPVGTAHLIVALDVFLPSGALTDYYQDLFAEIQGWVKQGRQVTLIPYAASINLGTDQNLAFPSVEPLSRQAKTLLRITPKQAIKKNRDQKLFFYQKPEEKYWSGCISLSKRCDFDYIDPFFYPSTFARRPALFNELKIDGLTRTGPNNWTERTLNEKADTPLAHYMGPNLGCPEAVFTTSNEAEIMSYLNKLTAMRRGGSLLPLAVDYALYLSRHSDKKTIILITKLTDHMAYIWPGSSAGTHFPVGDLPDILGCAENPEEMLLKTTADLQSFVKAGNYSAAYMGDINDKYTKIVRQEDIFSQGEEKKLFKRLAKFN